MPTTAAEPAKRTGLTLGAALGISGLVFGVVALIAAVLIALHIIPIRDLNAASGPPGPVGPSGPEGPAGPGNGPTGPSGPAGPGGSGPTGPRGFVGPVGLPGGIGPTGPQGEQGIRGVNGPTGPTGIGATGPGGPVGATGSMGPIGPAGNGGVVWTSSNKTSLKFGYQEPATNMPSYQLVLDAGCAYSTEKCVPIGYTGAAMFARPLRQVAPTSSMYIMYYDPTTFEVMYGNAAQSQAPLPRAPSQALPYIPMQSRARLDPRGVF